MAEIKNVFKDQDIELLDFPIDDNSRFGSDVMRAVKEFQVGNGAQVFRANASGIWLGSATFDTAPFRVSMAGVVTISQNLGTKNFTTTPTTPYNVGDLWTQGSGGAIKVCIVSRATGAYNAADWDLASNYQNSGQVTTIIGNTVTTGYINALSITAGSVSANNITAGTITGSTLQTASSGQRIIIDGSNNDVRFYDVSGTYQGRIVGSNSGSGSVFISGVNSVGLAIGGTLYLSATGGSLIVSQDISPSGTRYIGDSGSPFYATYSSNIVTSQILTLGGQIALSGGFYPTSSSTYDLGNSGAYWNKIWTNAIYGGTITGSSVNVGSGDVRAGGHVYLDSSGSNAYIYSTGTVTKIGSSNGVISTMPATSGTLKNAIVPTSKGYKALNCIEAPDVWFMDFTGKDKKLDPLFKEVTVSPYHYVKCVNGEYQVWGKRKGFKNTRFESKTRSEFVSNEKFLNLNRVL